MFQYPAKWFDRSIICCVCLSTTLIGLLGRVYAICLSSPISGLLGRVHSICHSIPLLGLLGVVYAICLSTAPGLLYDCVAVGRPHVESGPVP